LTVEDAALAEVAAGGNPSKGVVECAVPETVGRDSRENGSQALAFGFGAGELLGIGFDEIGSDGEAFRGEFAFFDVDICRAEEFFGGFGFGG